MMGKTSVVQRDVRTVPLLERLKTRPKLYPKCDIPLVNVST